MERVMLRYVGPEWYVEPSGLGGAFSTHSLFREFSRTTLLSENNLRILGKYHQNNEKCNLDETEESTTIQDSVDNDSSVSEENKPEQESLYETIDSTDEEVKMQETQSFMNNRDPICTYLVEEEIEKPIINNNVVPEVLAFKKTNNNNLKLKKISDSNKICIQDNSTKITTSSSSHKLETVKEIISKLKKDISSIVTFDDDYSSCSLNILGKIDRLECELKCVYILRETQAVTPSLMTDILSVKQRELNKLFNCLREDVFQAYLKLRPDDKYRVARRGGQMGCIYTLLGVLEREIKGAVKDIRALMSSQQTTRELVDNIQEIDYKQTTNSLPTLKVTKNPQNIRKNQTIQLETCKQEIYKQSAKITLTPGPKIMDRNRSSQEKISNFAKLSTEIKKFYTDYSKQEWLQKYFVDSIETQLSQCETTNLKLNHSENEYTIFDHNSENSVTVMTITDDKTVTETTGEDKLSSIKSKVDSFNDLAKTVTACSTYDEDDTSEKSEKDNLPVPRTISSHYTSVGGSDSSIQVLSEPSLESTTTAMETRLPLQNSLSSESTPLLSQAKDNNANPKKRDSIENLFIGHYALTAKTKLTDKENVKKRNKHVRIENGPAQTKRCLSEEKRLFQSMFTEQL